MAEVASEGTVKRPKPRLRPDLGSVAGILVALGGIFYGFFLEQGKAGYLMGESAALIVVGGCLGATLVGNPLSAMRGAVRGLRAEAAGPREPARRHDRAHKLMLYGGDPSVRAYLKSASEFFGGARIVTNKYQVERT